jgi:hypothetical protein
MHKRTGCLLLALAGIVVLAGGLLAVSATTGRLPHWTESWGPLPSSVTSWASSALSPSSPSAEATARPNADAGTPPVHRQTAPLSSAQLGAPLVHGAFVNACGAPDHMKVVVDATVKMGHSVGVTVTTDPPDPVVASCVERATRGMQWDISPKTGHVTVTY